MAKPGWCQHDAGILVDDELSPIAKKNFVDDVLKELRLGSAAVKHPLFPVNLNLPAQPSFANIPLEDPEAFPEFHKNVLGQYRSIARALDAQSRYTFLPICCPVSLAVSLGADIPKLKFPSEFITYGFALPMLATKLGYPMPIDLAAKIPSLISLPVPNLSIPPLDFEPQKLPDLFKFNAGFYGVPPILLTAALELLTKMPQLAMGVLSFDLSVFYDVIVGSKMFGDFDPSSALIWMVAQKVLAIRTAECILIYVVGTTMGSSSGGIVGGLGTALGYSPPPTATASADPQKLSIKAANAAKNQSWSIDNKSATAPSPVLRYTGFLLPQEVDDGKGSKGTNALNTLQRTAVGPLFARAVAFRAGGSTKFFTEKLQNVGTTFAVLENEAKLKGAHSAVTTTTPTVKEGDILVGPEVSLVVTSKTDKGSVFKGVLAGVPDSGNGGLRTSIVERTVEIRDVAGKLSFVNGTDVSEVRYVIDVKKLAEG